MLGKLPFLSFGISFSRMETKCHGIVFVRNYMSLKSFDGPASLMRSHFMISNSNYTADPLPWTHHKYACTISKFTTSPKFICGAHHMLMKQAVRRVRHAAISAKAPVSCWISVLWLLSATSGMQGITHHEQIIFQDIKEKSNTSFICIWGHSY